MSFPKIRIFNEPGGNPIPTHVEIDGKRIKGVRGVNFHTAVGEIPTVELDLISMMDSGIEIENPELKISFTPQTIHEAMLVLGISGVYEDNGNVLFLFDDGK